MLNDKSILITGGTGSFGKCFVKTVVQRYKPKKLIVFSRDELKQYEMRQELQGSIYDCLRYFIGDVRDLPRMRVATEEVDFVIHAAALKQVPATELNPFETVKTNILGGQNVIDASISSGVKKVIALSTDKAAAPINLYGATKLTSDKLFVAANFYYAGHESKFSVVRYGNVMGSRGSVIPFFLERQRTGILPITDMGMTRFNITLNESVECVLKFLDNMWGGELFVPKIPSYHIIDVAKAINEECSLESVGIRPGEKLHEEMITKTDSFNTLEFDDYYVILPSTEPRWSIKEFINGSSKKPGRKVAEGFEYSSNTNEHFLSIEELRNLIQTQLNV